MGWPTIGGDYNCRWLRHSTSTEGGDSCHRTTIGRIPQLCRRQIRLRGEKPRAIRARSAVRPRFRERSSSVRSGLPEMPAQRPEAAKLAVFSASLSKNSPVSRPLDAIYRARYRGACLRPSRGRQKTGKTLKKPGLRRFVRCPEEIARNHSENFCVKCLTWPMRRYTPKACRERLRKMSKPHKLSIRT
jgi:hypothetical protein